MIKVLILAGGKGNRLRPLTVNTPKPIVPIANIPFLFYQIEQVRKAGLTEIILSLSYQPRKIKDLFGDGSQFGLTIRYTIEEVPLGTAGAVKMAENLIDDTTVVMNGDILTDLDLQTVIDEHKRRQAAVTIVLKAVRNPAAYGLVETDQDGHVQRFIEKPKEDEITCDTINAGTYVLEPGLLKYIPADEEYSFERAFFPTILQQHERFFAITTDAYWLDIGTPFKYLQAHYDIMEGKIALPNFPGTHQKAERTNFSGALIDKTSLIETDCQIKPTAVIEHSVIGRGCRIEEGVLVRKSVVWPGTRIEKRAILDGCLVGRNCVVGEAAKIHDGKILGDKSIIADYSEI
ncbi:MAG: NDP-sugar synthase [Acidobacteria bacterium]|nr:NDP-sugar synthase [Acidobacteriota bacterium]MBI3658416.1 NDP-sugar synthase [Acidobacteriota bacterium]